MADTGPSDGRGEPAAAADAIAGLCGGIAHEFNNLLTVIRGSAELLQAPGGDPAVHPDQLAAIVAAADAATLLTARLLAFARQQPLRAEPVSPRALFESLRAELAGDPRLRVRIMVQAGARPVSADPVQLAAALHAIVDNAREAMPEGGVLTFSASDAGDAVRISVADSGGGMDEAVASRAFEPFFTTKAVGAGSGLGLSQVQGFAAQSGGSVRIETAPGCGAAIILTLPAANVEPLAAPPPAALPTGARILLVEDSNTVAAFAEALLAEMGCAVTRAACASEALDRLAEPHARFDLMFSDIVMPGMSGIDLADRVRREHPALPILLATGHSDQAAREGSRFPVLPKPYRRDALAQMMGRALAA